jgi:hypothetical protein
MVSSKGTGTGTQSLGPLYIEGGLRPRGPVVVPEVFWTGNS